MSELMQDLSFCILLILLKIVISRFIYVVTGDRILFMNAILLCTGTVSLTILLLIGTVDSISWLLCVMLP
jgi:hypothetical protein